MNQSVEFADGRNRRITSQWAMVVLAVVAAAGCGSGTDDATGSTGANQSTTRRDAAPAANNTSQAAPGAAERGARSADDAAAGEAEPVSLDANGDGSISGVIRVTGDVPELPPLIQQGDPGLKEPACAAHGVPDESLLVDRAADHGLANVFVYLAKAPAGYRAAATPEPLEFDQQNCRFLQRAIAVQTGQPVLVKSADPFAHNVNNEPVRNTKLNVIVQPNDRVGIKLVYDRAEPVPVRIKCDIHPWMRAWHLVIDHPFVAVSDAQGKFTIDGLPPGKHKLRVWHERAGLLERGYDVEVKAGEAAELPLSYPVEKFSNPQ